MGVIQIKINLDKFINGKMINLKDNIDIILNKLNN